MIKTSCFAANHLIDIGLAAGNLGGEIVGGAPASFLKKIPQQQILKRFAKVTIPAVREQAMDIFIAIERSKWKQFKKCSGEISFGKINFIRAYQAVANQL
ncbi:MAG: hypothetical protein IPF62_10985 [Bacteroidetes bacterium]|nr:hypothetical protein [Bacteroidota bacterium]